MAIDPIVLGKVNTNSYILGMAFFSLAAIFNTVAFFVVIVTGIVRQSTGIYLLFLTVADILYFVCGLLIGEFYNDLIDVDVFAESGEPVMLCQAIYFFREMFYYWRWMLMTALVIDRCVFVSGVSMARLRIAAIVVSLVTMAVSCGLAGYWAHWVEDILIPGEYVPKSCRFTLAPADDNSSTWFFMEALVHVAVPDVLCVVPTFIAAIVLACRLRGKAGEAMEEDDVSLSNAVVLMGIVNVIFMIPFLIVNCILLYFDKIWDLYDFSDEVDTNLRYTAILGRKIKEFGFCLTFFLLLFARPFRSCCCKN